MRRICLGALLLVAVAAVTTSALARPGQQPVPAPQYVLKVGDTMRVEDGSVGCQVTRRAGRTVVECRPSGALKGRYGAFVSNRTVSVARFRTNRTAQVVFTARHKRGWRTCGKSSRVARATGGCR